MAFITVVFIAGTSSSNNGVFGRHRAAARATPYFYCCCCFFVSVQPATRRAVPPVDRCGAAILTEAGAARHS
jgi:hypothetical protein